MEFFTGDCDCDCKSHCGKRAHSLIHRQNTNLILCLTCKFESNLNCYLGKYALLVCTLVLSIEAVGQIGYKLLEEVHPVYFDLEIQPLTLGQGHRQIHHQNSIKMFNYYTRWEVVQSINILSYVELKFSEVKFDTLNA